MYNLSKISIIVFIAIGMIFIPGLTSNPTAPSKVIAQSANKNSSSSSGTAKHNTNRSSVCL